MSRRIAIVCVAALALMGATEVAAKKKKKPKIPTGPYVGATSNGIPLTVTLDPGRRTGSVTYCAMTATFTVTGRSFAVSHVDPVSMDSINATGVFNAKQRSVSGSMAPNGCDSTPQTYLIKR
jgi:hypothetical protein